MNLEKLEHLFRENVYKDKEIEIRNELDKLDCSDENVRHFLIRMIHEYDCNLYVYEKIRDFFDQLNFYDKVAIKEALEWDERVDDAFLDTFYIDYESQNKIINKKIESYTKGIELLQIQYRELIEKMKEEYDHLFINEYTQKRAAEIRSKLTHNATQIITILDENKYRIMDFQNEYKIAILILFNEVDVKEKVKLLDEYMAYFGYSQEICSYYLETVLSYDLFTYDRAVMSRCNKCIEYLDDNFNVIFYLAKMIQKRMCYNMNDLYNLSIQFADLLCSNLNCLGNLTINERFLLIDTCNIILDNSIIGENKKDLIRNAMLVFYMS